MKRLLPLVIALSLGLNAVFAFYAFRAGTSPADSAAKVSTPSAASAVVAATSAGPAAVADMIPSLGEKQLANTIAELRSAGFPPEVVRAIASALLNEQFAARQKALDPDADKRAFWKDRNSDPKYQLAANQLWAEQRRALREILGPDAESQDPMTLARQRQQFGNLSPEKMTQAQDVVRDFNEKRQEVYASGVFAAADREKITELEKQQRAALAQVLSPAEMEEYDLRSSNTGRTLRTELSAFNPTEEEFRTIFKLRQPFDEQWNRNYDSGLPSQEDMTRRSTANKELSERIKAMLGPVRGPEYELATDSNYRRTSQVVARLELPPETTKQLWDVQRDFQQRSGEIRRSAPDQPTRIAQLTALQQEASAKVGSMLGGTRGLEAYKQFGGTWLNNMVPRPIAPKN
jgi:hypothetical protein